MTRAELIASLEVLDRIALPLQAGWYRRDMADDLGWCLKVRTQAGVLVDVSTPGALLIFLADELPRRAAERVPRFDTASSSGPS